MIPIKDPFNLDIDVNGNTPLEKLTAENYGLPFKKNLLDQQKFTDALAKGIFDLSIDPNVEDFILKEIHISVAYQDDPIVKTILHAGVSAYATPLNVALKAESGSGKSYSTTETINFLPPEDVMFIGSDSPKVFSHLNGIRKVVKDGVEVLFDNILEPMKPDKNDFDLVESYNVMCQKYREDLKEYQQLKENSFYEVDLRNKIIVYLESINPETFKMLKVTMSHDGPSIDHRFVDDKGKVHVTRLIGAPVLIFNSLDTVYTSEFATRTLTISPVVSKEKIEAAMRISNRKACYPWLFDPERLNVKIIQEYLRKVRDTLRAGKIKTINVFDEVQKEFSANQARDMRDFNKFLELMPCYAIIKLFQHPTIVLKGKRCLVPTIQDFLDAKAVFDSISETTKTGTEMRILCFYWDCVAPFTSNGATVETLTDLYNKDKKKAVSSRTIRAWLDRLVEIEFVDAREGEQLTDKGLINYQKKTFHPLKLKGTNAILETAKDLVAILEKAFDLWLKTCAEEIVTHPIYILKIDGTAVQISLEEFSEIVKGRGASLTSQVFKAESTTEQQTDVKTIAKPESAQETDKNVLYYRKLIVGENFRCDGESVGSQCLDPAKYEMLSTADPTHYCEIHFQRVLKDCTDNSFKLVEKVIAPTKTVTVKRSKNGQKCDYCATLTSEFELTDNAEPFKIFVCELCLKTNVIPAYKAKPDYNIVMANLDDPDANAKDGLGPETKEYSDDDPHSGEA